MKNIVETVGPIMLSDMSANQVVEPDRPCVVENTTFIQQRVTSKQLVLLETDVKVTDEELRDAWLAGDYQKSAKQPVEPPKVDVVAGPANPSEVPAPKVDVELVSARAQMEGESDEDYIEYLDKLAQEDKAKLAQKD